MTIHAEGATRAGLLTASVRAVYKSAFPEEVEITEEQVERPFDIKADNFIDLFAALIDASLESSRTNGDAYEGIQFTLATDKQAKGSFLGRQMAGFQAPAGKASIDPISLKKNEEGKWEATVNIA